MIASRPTPPPPNPDRFLYIVDDSLERPYLRAQVPTLLARLTSPTRRFDILSFEPRLPAENHPLWRELAAAGIGWAPVVLPRRPRFLQPAVLIIGGVIKALSWHRARPYTAVHCRGHLPAAVGWALRRFAGLPYLFELRGLPAEENVALRRWTAGGARFSFAKSWESRFLRRAALLAAPTAAFCDALAARPEVRKNGISTLAIPNSIDLVRYARSEEVRARVRERHGWSGRLTFGYAEHGRRVRDTLPLALQYFRACQAEDPEAALSLYLSGPTQPAWKIITDFGISPDDVIVIEGQPGLLPDYLSAVDVALAFTRPRGLAQALISPVRLGEYLACGLPVVVSAPAGDAPALIEPTRIGAVVRQRDPAALAESARDLIQLVLTDPDVPARCRAAARAEFSIETVSEKWDRIYTEMTQP